MVVIRHPFSYPSHPQVKEKYRDSALVLDSAITYTNGAYFLGLLFGLGIAIGLILGNND